MDQRFKKTAPFLPFIGMFLLGAILVWNELSGIGVLFIFVAMLAIGIMIWTWVTMYLKRDELPVLHLDSLEVLYLSNPNLKEQFEKEAFSPSACYRMPDPDVPYPYLFVDREHLKVAIYNLSKVLVLDVGNLDPAANIVIYQNKNANSATSEAWGKSCLMSIFLLPFGYYAISNRLIYKQEDAFYELGFQLKTKSGGCANIPAYREYVLGARTEKIEAFKNLSKEIQSEVFYLYKDIKKSIQ